MEDVVDKIVCVESDVDCNGFFCRDKKTGEVVEYIFYANYIEDGCAWLKEGLLDVGHVATRRECSIIEILSAVDFCDRFIRCSPIEKFFSYMENR